MRIGRYTAVFIGVLQMSACVAPGGGVRPPSSPPGVPEGTGTPSPTRGLARKRVAAKHEPNTLVAEDGTACQVTAGRYRDTKVGDSVLCVWQ